MDVEARRRAVDRVAQIIYDAFPRQGVGVVQSKTWAAYEDQDTYYRRMAEAVLDQYVAEAVAQAVKERDYWKQQYADQMIRPCHVVHHEDQEIRLEQQAEEIARLWKALTDVLQCVRDHGWEEGEDPRIVDAGLTLGALRARGRGEK